MKKLILTCIALMAGFSIMAQNGALKLNPEKNKIYRFRSLSSQNVSQTVNGMEQTTSTSIKTLVSLKMLDAAADFMVVEVRFDTVVSNTNAMGKTTVISSAAEGNMASEDVADVMTAVMNRLSRNPLYAKMDATGKVIDIVNYSMLSDMILKDTALIKGVTAPMLKAQIMNTISRDALKPMIEAFTYNLPGREVKPGDRWEISVPVSSGGMELVISTGYQLKNINGNNAGISAESAIKASVNAKPLEYGGAKVTYDGLTGRAKSELVIDTKTGLPKSSSGKTYITGNLNVSVQGMNMQIPMTINGQSEMSAIQ